VIPGSVQVIRSSSETSSDNIEAGFQLRTRDGGRILSIPAILSVIGRSKKIVGGHFVLSSVGEPPAHIVSSRPVLKEYDIEMHVMDRIRDSNGDYHAYGTIDCLQEHFLEEIGNSICASAQNSEQPYPTLTLLTGHGEGGYFNTEGFFGAVCLAIKSGIDVNLWAWSEKLSRNFGELEKRGGRDGYGEFHIIYWDAFEKEISVKLK